MPSSTIQFVEQRSDRHDGSASGDVLQIGVSQTGSATLTSASSSSPDTINSSSNKNSTSKTHRRKRFGIFGTFFTGIVEVLRSLFLPVGYPNSVTPDYFAFQSWDTVQAMCSYLRGILATQAILDGVGVGDETKTVASATLQWVTRDGASMLGGLAFTWWGGKNFDKSVKFWRLFADTINDVGLTLEMLSPLCGEYFLLVACTFFFFFFFSTHIY